MHRPIQSPSLCALVVTLGLLGGAASAQDAAAVRDRDNAARQDGRDVQTDGNAMAVAHDNAERDAAALRQADATGNGVRAAKDRSALDAQRHQERGEHKLADEHREQAGKDLHAARGQAHLMARRETHDIREDKHNLGEHHEAAVHDDRALDKAEADGNSAQAAKDKARLDQQRAGEAHDHAAATKERQTLGVDRKDEQPK